jgi:hypothetical protein
VLRIPKGSQKMTLLGKNLMDSEGPPRVYLNDQPLAVADHDHDRIVVELPAEAHAGTLAVAFGDGAPLHYELAFDPATGARDDWAAEG